MMQVPVQEFDIEILGSDAIFDFMVASLDTFTADGRVIISFPESAVPSQERADFIAMLKTEWALRQSRWTEDDAQSLAAEVDSDWWNRNRSRILGAIGEA